jgi:hypothetical protein
VRENVYHFVIGLIWLIVTVVAVLVYISEGNVFRRRKKDFDTKELLTNMHCGGGAEGAGFPPGAIVSKEISNVRFHSDPNLKPTEIQPPTIEQRTPAVLARKPAPCAPLRRALQNVGTIAQKGGMLGLIRIKNIGFLIQSSLLDKRISLAIALLITFCTGFAADLVWQSSRQVLSVPQAAPAPVALSLTLKQQLEAMSSGLAAVQQSIDELSSGLGQMRRDIINLQTTEQALFDKISEPPPRPAAAAPRSIPRPSQAPIPAR